jgi:DNA invertase Pin-like site-specific DNA recombinase
LVADVDPFVLQVYASLAEKKRRSISQRTTAALAEADGEGGWQISGIGFLIQSPAPA